MVRERPIERNFLHTYSKKQRLVDMGHSRKEKEYVFYCEFYSVQKFKKICKTLIVATTNYNI